MLNSNPNDTTLSINEYSEDVLEFLSLLMEEYLKQTKSITMKKEKYYE